MVVIQLKTLTALGTAIADGGERPTEGVDTADGTDADGTAEPVADEVR